MTASMLSYLQNICKQSANLKQSENAMMKLISAYQKESESDEQDEQPLPNVKMRLKAYEEEVDKKPHKKGKLAGRTKRDDSEFVI